jgi:hypothetical protein
MLISLLVGRWAAARVLRRDQGISLMQRPPPADGQPGPSGQPHQAEASASQGVLRRLDQRRLHRQELLLAPLLPSPAPTNPPAMQPFIGHGVIAAAVAAPAPSAAAASGRPAQRRAPPPQDESSDDDDDDLLGPNLLDQLASSLRSVLYARAGKSGEQEPGEEAGPGPSTRLGRSSAAGPAQPLGPASNPDDIRWVPEVEPPKELLPAVKRVAPGAGAGKETGLAKKVRGGKEGEQPFDKRPVFQPGAMLATYVACSSRHVAWSHIAWRAPDQVGTCLTSVAEKDSAWGVPRCTWHAPA